MIVVIARKSASFGVGIYEVVKWRPIFVIARFCDSRIVAIHKSPFYKVVNSMESF